MASLDRIEADADKGNFIRSQPERSFLRNFFLICEFIPQTCNVDFRKQCANTLSCNLESHIWEPIGAHGEKANILTE